MNSQSKSGKKDAGITLLYNDKLGHGQGLFHPLDSPDPDLEINTKLGSILEINIQMTNRIRMKDHSHDLD